MTKFWREPLVHFLVGALAVFAFFWATGLDRNTEDRSILIDQSGIERLAAEWKRNYNRLPTKAELDALIDNQIAEEIYYREALRLGLDRDDPVVRRRLAKKMRFIEEDQDALEPTDSELQLWLDDNAAKYAAPGKVDLKQIYLGQDALPDTAQMQEIISGLNSGQALPQGLEQPLSLPTKLHNVPWDFVTRDFGERFTDAAEKLPTGTWAGPVQSGFGFHLVKIMPREKGRTPELKDIRQRVENDWRRTQAEARQKEAAAKLRSQYDISIAGRE